MKQALEIIKNYITCEDTSTRNKFYNLLDSFWHKDDGDILKSHTTDEAGNITFTFLKKDGSTSKVVLPALPNSKPISFIENLTETLNNLVQKVPGKGLSTNDLTTELLNKLNSLQNYQHPAQHTIAEVENLGEELSGKQPIAPEGWGFSQENYSPGDKAKVDTTFQQVSDHEIRIGVLEGMELVADMANQKILIRNSEGVIISEVAVGWLNNEGTTFFYNDATSMLELRNDAGEVLSSIPANAFVSNLAKTVALSGNTFQLKDTEGNVISSVNFEISNIGGLASALADKANDNEVIKGILTDEGEELPIDAQRRVKLPPVKIDETKVTVKLENISALYEGKEGETIQTLGYFENGDGGGGIFYWDATSEEVADGGIILDVEGVNVGRWKRIITNNSISYAMFGVPQDPAIDAAPKIKKAHEFANANGYEVVNPHGEYWLIVPNEIPIRTNVSWGETVFHIDESKSLTGTARFVVEKTNGFVGVPLDATAKSSFLTKFRKGVRQIPELSAYENHFFIVEDANDVVNRNGGSGGTYAKNDMFVVDKGGIIIGDIIQQLNDYTTLKACRLEDNYVDIYGGSFRLNSLPNPDIVDNYIKSGFIVRRTKTRIHNQVVLLEDTADPNTEMPYDTGFYLAEDTYDFTLNNVKPLARKYTESGTYGLGLRGVMKIAFNDLIGEGSGDYWGISGCFNVKDLYVNRCVLSRIDVHFNAYNVYIDRCRIGDKSITLAGGGDLHISATSVASNTFVIFRHDFGGRWDGDVIIDKNCRLIVSSLGNVRILHYSTDDFDYNYPIVFSTTSKVTDFTVDYSQNPTNTNTLDIFSIPTFRPTSGEDYFFPEEVLFENIKVVGREEGARLFVIGNINHFKTRKKGGFNSAGQLITNTNLVFKNVKTATPMEGAGIFTTNVGAYDAALGENSIYIDLTIDSCGVVGSHFANTAVKAKVINSTVKSFRFNDGAAQNGSLMFLDCLMSPDITDGTIRAMYATQTTTPPITYVNCKWNTPVVNGVKVNTLDDFNLVIRDAYQLNSRVYGTHVDSRVSEDVIAFMADNSIGTLLEEFTEMLFLHDKASDTYVRRIKGSTADRPAGVPVGFRYYDTTLSLPMWWTGSAWTLLPVDSNLLHKTGAETKAGNLTLSDDLTVNKLTKLSGMYSIENGVIDVPVPKGGKNNFASGVGAIQVKLPVMYSSTLFKFTVDIYDQNQGTPIRVSVGGYNISGSFPRFFAHIIGSDINRDLAVRFGDDGTKNCIWIGEVDTDWSVLNVVVRDFQGSGSSVTKEWAENWVISKVTAFGTVKTTATNNLIASDWNKLKSIPADLLRKRPIKIVNNSTQYTFVEGDQYKHLVFTGAASNIIVPSGVFAESDLLEGTFKGAEATVVSENDVNGDPLITLDYPDTLAPTFAQKGLFGIKFTAANAATLGGHQKPVE